MSDIEGMRRVLEKHRVIGGRCRSCGIDMRMDYYRAEAHVAAELAKAGYGYLHDAWAEGHYWEYAANPYPETTP